MKRMSDLIERQAAIDAIGSIIAAVRTIIDDEFILISKADAQAVLMKLPSAQPQRKMGRWLTTDAYPHNVYCSECYTRFAQTHWAVWEDGSLPRNFCPNCGADMREVDE